MPNTALRAILSQPWAILPEALADILALADERAEGFHAAVPSQRARGGAVAVISVMGVISQRPDMFEMLFGGGSASTEQIGAAFRAAVADDTVKAIVLNIDSPGGTTPGVMELADEIYKARGSKPIVAVANSMAASAAYWIATAADELVVTPGGEVGSIGVYTVHQDMSALFEDMGVKMTLISAGDHKTEGNPYEPLSADAREYIQQRIDDRYAAFVGAVARNRGVTESVVNRTFGQGRMSLAKAAVSLGMADRVGTLASVLAKLGASPDAAQAAMARAENPALPIAATEPVNPDATSAPVSDTAHAEAVRAVKRNQELGGIKWRTSAPA